MTEEPYDDLDLRYENTIELNYCVPEKAIYNSKYYSVQTIEDFYKLVMGQLPEIPISFSIVLIQNVEIENKLKLISMFNNDTISHSKHIDNIFKETLQEIEEKTFLGQLTKCNTESSNITRLDVSTHEIKVKPLNVKPKNRTRHLGDDKIVIGSIYTRAERREKIRRYREKRNRWLCSNKKPKILYKCRSDFARNRLRVGGRFVKKEDMI